MNIKIIYTDGGRRESKLDYFLGVGAGIYAYEYSDVDMSNYSCKWPSVPAIFTPMGICCSNAVKAFSSDASVENAIAIMYRKLSADSSDKKLKAWENETDSVARGKMNSTDITPIMRLGKTAKIIIPYLSNHTVKEINKIANKASVPITITEMIIPLDPTFTSNVAELISFIEALKLSKDMDVVYIYSDSDYVVRGVTEYMEGWHSAQWRKGDGELVRNIEYWKEIYTLYTDLTSNTCVTVSHIYSHRGNYGNEVVDTLATLATMMSGNGRLLPIIDKYLLSTARAHTNGRSIPRHAALKWIYKYTNSDDMKVVIKGEEWHGYITGNHASKSSVPPEMIGKPQGDALFGLVFQRDQIPIVKKLADTVYDRVYRYCKNKMDKIDFFTLINSGNVNRDITTRAINVGLDSLKYNYGQRYLENLTGDPIVISMDKPMLSRRIFDIAETMKLLLGATMAKLGIENELGIGDAVGIDIHDITEYFTDGKKMLPMKELAIEVTVDGDLVRLAIGIDVPPRIVLMDEARHNLNVKLVIYNRTKNSFMHFCYLESDNIYSMWYNPYSNTRLLLDTAINEDSKDK